MSKFSCNFHPDEEEEKDEHPFSGKEEYLEEVKVEGLSDKFDHHIRFVDSMREERKLNILVVDDQIFNIVVFEDII